MEDWFLKLWEQSPGLAIVAGVLYLFWRTGERRDAAFREALRELGKTCHEAHHLNAESFRETTERLTERYEDQAHKATEIATKVHTTLGAVGEQLRSFTDLSRDLTQALRTRSS